MPATTWTTLYSLYHMDHLVPQVDGSRVCKNEALFQATSARFGCPELLVWQFHHAICRPENGLHRLNLLTEARRVLVLPSLDLLTEASRGVRRDEAQCSSMFPRRGAMQQHLKSHAATCAEQSHWLHSGYDIGYTGHAQQQHRQKRQTNRQRWTRAATTQTKAADKPPTQQNTCSNNTNGCLL